MTLKSMGCPDASVAGDQRCSPEQAGQQRHQVEQGEHVVRRAVEAAEECLGEYIALAVAGQAVVGTDTGHGGGPLVCPEQQTSAKLVYQRCRGENLSGTLRPRQRGDLVRPLV